MKRLNPTVKIDPKFTADDWQLFTASMNCNGAARKLNTTLRQAVNKKGSTAFEVRLEMHPVMRELSKFGANDSEPQWLLASVLDEVYRLDK
jgi:hypothetical protein